MAGQQDVERVCPLCGGARSRPFLSKGTLQLVRCGSCAMVYSNPIETDLANGLFYDRMGTSFYLSEDKLRSDFAPVRFERELRLFRCHCPAGSVLDVGCSTGAFLHQLGTRYPGAYETTGTDVTSAALDHAASLGIRVVRQSFLEMTAAQGPWQTITFWAVIEHLAEPKRFLEKARDLLEPGGFCFVLVPNLDSLAVRLLGAKYRYIMPDHVNYFTAQTLGDLAMRVGGFRVERMTTTHFNPIVIAQDFRGGTDRVSNEQRAHLLKRTTRWKQNPLLRPVKGLYRGVEACLASLGLADNLVMILRKQTPKPH